MTKSWNHLSFVNISPTLVIDASTERSSRVLQHGNPKNVNFFQKVWIWRNWILSVPRVSVCREKKSLWFRQYQSYISNWYVNGKVFTSTTTWETKNLIFFSKKFEIEFDLYFDLCWRAEIIQVGLNMHLYADIGDASSSLWGSTSSYNVLFIFLIALVWSGFGSMAGGWMWWLTTGSPPSMGSWSSCTLRTGTSSGLPCLKRPTPSESLFTFLNLLVKVGSCVPLPGAQRLYSDNWAYYSETIRIFVRRRSQAHLFLRTVFPVYILFCIHQYELKVSIKFIISGVYLFIMTKVVQCSTV